MNLEQQHAQCNGQSLNLSQLLVLLLTGDTNQQTVQHFVQMVAFESNDFKNLVALNNFTDFKWRQFDSGLIMQFQTLWETAQRLVAQQQLVVGEKITIAQLAQHLLTKWHQLQHEELISYFFNSQNQLLLEKIIFKGSLQKAAAQPREILRFALQLPCSQLLIAHKHPSGNLQPSTADIIFTQRLQNCSNLLGIKLLDHLIIGDDQFSSFQRLELL